MFANKTTARGRVVLAALAIGGSLGVFLTPAKAAPLGEYFPVPNGFNLTGIAKDSLLSTETTWLQDGLDNIAKAKKETEAALEKAKSPTYGLALVAETAECLEAAERIARFVRQHPHKV